MYAFVYSLLKKLSTFYVNYAYTVHLTLPPAGFTCFNCSWLGNSTSRTTTWQLQRSTTQQLSTICTQRWLWATTGIWTTTTATCGTQACLCACATTRARISDTKVSQDNERMKVRDKKSMKVKGSLLGRLQTLHKSSRLRKLKKSSLPFSLRRTIFIRSYYLSLFSFESKEFFGSSSHYKIASLSLIPHLSAKDSWT